MAPLPYCSQKAFTSSQCLCQLVYRACCAAADDMPPAVWITDDQRFAFASFTVSPTTKSRLRGTLMIVSITHGGRTNGVEVSYVDAAGHRSPTATTIAI